MLRGKYRPDALTGERYFRWRGGDVSRLEGLADAVFALALTLLVVRLEVPETFAEVEQALGRAPVYVACFAFFLWVWYCHYQFHRRYGLEGPLTVTIDGMILFVVLMFALPLRYMADSLYDAIALGVDPTGAFGDGGGALLMSLYSGGFALIFALLALQTWTALRRRGDLELDEVEVLVTRNTIRTHLASSAVGVASLLLAPTGLLGGTAAGMVFWVLGPLHGFLGWRHGRAVHAKAAELGMS
ncbi:MAG: TMEM175 family protein [Planctomycetota bacterium]